MSERTVSVSYATADGTAVAGADYSATSGTLLFSPGDTVHSITVPITNDADIEAVETFLLAISVTNGLLAGTTTRTVSGTILDNDSPPSISVGNVEVNENDGTAHFHVTLSQDFDQTVTVDFATANGTA
ncbi:MAG: Calx-beta domain-containing protein [Myxococcales bacterium]